MDRLEVWHRGGRTKRLSNCGEPAAVCARPFKCTGFGTCITLSLVLHKCRVVSKSGSMLGIQHSHALIPSFPLLYPSPPSKSLVWRRQFKENSRSVKRQPQSNIQTLRRPRRSAPRSLKRRRRVSPLVDENHHQDEPVEVEAAAEVVMIAVMMAMVVRLVRGHRDSVCGVLLFRRDCELAFKRVH
jgi:hypothetical protein